MAKKITPSQSKNVNEFLAAAEVLFCEGNEGRHSSNYIEVHAKLGKDHLPDSNKSSSGLSPIYPIVDPIEFLVGDIDKGPAAYISEEEMPEQSVAFVVGRYGLGKTELLFQIVAQSKQPDKKKHFKSQILPVNLAFCRRYLDLLENHVSVDKFLTLLFSRILNKAKLDIEFVRAEIVPRVQSGEIILLLDGLDELIVNDSSKHKDFLASLPYAFTQPSSADGLPQKLRIVVSARLEYLSVVTDPGATDVLTHLNSRLPKGKRVQVCFLLLDLFESSRVQTYIEYRLKKKGKEVYQSVMQRPGVLNMLRRPLLLRMFCDLAEHKKADTLIAQLKDPEDTTGLLKAFVEYAKEDELLNKEDHLLTEKTGYTWENDRLAYACLDIYEEGRDHLRVEDVKKILIRKGASPPPATRRMQRDKVIENLSDGEVLLSVHKCPFLIKEKEERQQYSVKFAHRIFLEYFTARGMMLELKEYRERGKRGKGDKFIAFDDLVLNVDMRKFLKGLVDELGERVWFEETKRAYGLNDEDRGQWKNRRKLNFKELDDKREILLQSMTNPEHTEASSINEIEEAILWFLEKNDQWLHPRYLVPNYEAITVYIWNHRWEDRARQINLKFREVLERKLDEIDCILQNNTLSRKGPPRLSYELLMERILNIGNRLHYAWAKRYAETKKDKLPVKDDKTRLRIETILNSIINFGYIDE